MPPPPPPNVSIAWKVWVGSIVSFVLATVAVFARLLARRISSAKLWWDDLTIVLALVRLDSVDRILPLEAWN